MLSIVGDLPNDQVTAVAQTFLGVDSSVLLCQHLPPYGPTPLGLKATGRSTAGQSPRLPRHLCCNYSNGFSFFSNITDGGGRRDEKQRQREGGGGGMDERERERERERRREGGRERERGGRGERERERERQTDRQTDRQADRQADRQTDRYREREWMSDLVYFCSFVIPQTKHNDGINPEFSSLARQSTESLALYSYVNKLSHRHLVSP